MEREFKFNLGDVVRTKDGCTLVSPGDAGKEYREHLTVVYRFWDGMANVYVLNTGDRGLCLTSDEEPLELEEKAPRPVGECMSYYLGHVYRINDILVAAEGIDKAIRSFRDFCDYDCGEEEIEAITLQDKKCSIIQIWEGEE